MIDYTDPEMIAEECFEIAEKLLDPDYNVRVNEYGYGFNIIEPAKHLYDAAQQTRNKYVIEASITMAHQLLLRLLVESPHVYAITVGQFPGFDGFAEMLISEGAEDIEGFIWLIPKPWGTYIERKYPKGK